MEEVIYGIFVGRGRNLEYDAGFVLKYREKLSDEEIENYLRLSLLRIMDEAKNELARMGVLDKLQESTIHKFVNGVQNGLTKNGLPRLKIERSTFAIEDGGDKK